MGWKALCSICESVLTVFFCLGASSTSSASIIIFFLINDPVKVGSGPLLSDAGNHANSVSSLPLKKWKKMNFSKFRLFFHYQICNRVNMNITEMFLPDLICREVTMKTLQTGHPSQSHLIYNIRMLGLWSIVLLTDIFIYAVGQWFVPFQLYYNKMLIDQ